MAERFSDTTPEAERIYRSLLQQRTGAERLRMACEMFDVAKRLALASLPAHVREDPAARSAALLRRFYGRDLAPDVLEAVLARLEQRR